MRYKIEQCMYLKNEKKGFWINRRNGTTCYIFLHFINPVDIEINGEMTHAHANACIIYPPGMPQHYEALTHPLYHSYVHFTVSEGEKIEQGLPIGRVFYTNVSDEIAILVEGIVGAYMLHNDNFEKRTTDYQQMQSNYLERLFRLLVQGQQKKSVADRNIVPRDFERLRTQIYQDPVSWNVPKMMGYVHLSRARFQTKYRQLFGVTPNEDLICATLERAELLLKKGMKVIDVAGECGFSNAEYFIRVFKKHRGYTPGRYRDIKNTEDPVD